MSLGDEERKIMVEFEIEKAKELISIIERIIY